MSAKVTDKGLLIDIAWLCEQLSDEDRRSIAHHLAFDDLVFEMVVGRLLGETVFDCWYSIPDFKAQELRERIVGELAEPIARTCLARVIQERNQARIDEQRSRDWAWKMFHAWPDDHYDARPDAAPYAYQPAPSTDTVDAELAKA